MRLPILRKEIRYRAGGLLALPVLAVAGGWSVYALARSNNYNYESILSPAFAVPVTMICAAVGLSVGLWQVLQETRPGSWAFLRHRPVSATRLFFGKLAAALFIYLLVVGVPLSGVIWWAATPGHFFGPWLWQMAVPSLLDLLCGTVYVLAGMLIGLREARWFGSRLLPVGLAIVCSGMTWALPWLWLALLAVAVAWLVLLPAAWGALTSRGRERRQGWIGRTLTATTLVPAMIAIPMMAGGLCVLTIDWLRPQPTATPQAGYYVQGAELYETSYYDGVNAYRRVVNDKGIFLKDTPYEPLEISGTSDRLISDWDAAGYRPLLMRRHYREARSYLLMQRGVYAEGGGNEQWYYLRDPRYIVGYSRRVVGEAQLIGYIGANGFAKKPGDATPFDVGEFINWWSGQTDLVLEPGRVIRVNLLRRECITVFIPPQGERAVNAVELQVPPRPAATFRMLLLVATDKAIYVVDEHQKVLLRQEHIGAAYPVVSVGVNDNLKTFGLLYSPAAGLRDSPKVFIRVSADGAVLTRTDMPRLPQQPWKSNTFGTVAEGVYLPPVLNIIGVIFEPQQKLHMSLWLLFESMTICAVASAAIAVWLLKRAGERRGWTIFWLITVLLLGISGVLLMLAMRQWLPRVRCGHCGRKSVTGGFACQHCGTVFPIPDPGAIGIWDDAEPALVT